MDGKIEVVNQSLGNLLCCILGEKPKQGDLALPQEKFYYNNYVNRSIKTSPFQIFYNQSHQGVIDLVSLPLGDRTSDDGVTFVEHLNQFQKYVKQKLEDTNVNYKIFVDASQRKQIFDVGDFMMVCMMHEQFPIRTYHKLKYKKIGLCKIIRKIDVNSYEVNLP